MTLGTQSCAEYYDSPFATIKTVCDANNGTTGTGGCPSDMLLGHCIYKGLEAHSATYSYGASSLAATYKQICTGAGTGTWCAAQ